MTPREMRDGVAEPRTFLGQSSAVRGLAYQRIQADAPTTAAYYNHDPQASTPEAEGG